MAKEEEMSFIEKCCEFISVVDSKAQPYEEERNYTETVKRQRRVFIRRKIKEEGIDTETVTREKKNAQRKVKSDLRHHLILLS